MELFGLVRSSFLAKINVNGVCQWAKTIALGDYSSNYKYFGSGKSIKIYGNNIYITGLTQRIISLGLYFWSFIGKYDMNGTKIWLKENGNTSYFGDEWGTKINVDQNNNVFAMIQYLSKNSLKKLDADGRVIYSIDFPVESTFDLDKNGNSIIGSYTDGKIYPLENYSDVVLLKYDGMGKKVWNYTLAGKFEDKFVSMICKKNGEVLFTAAISDSIIINNELIRGYFWGLVSVKDTAIVPDNPIVIRGQIYQDKNLNCKNDVGDLPLKGYFIKADPGEFYAMTDENGNYELKLDTGAYTLSQIIPANKNQITNQTCPGVNSTYSVSIKSPGKDSSGFDFGNRISDCSFLSVNISSGRQRRCARNKTIVNYANNGNSTANNVVVKIIYPNYSIPLSSSIPWNQKIDSAIIFNLGTLDAGNTGSITIVDSVMCISNITGLTQCTKAIISPANNCVNNNPNWDGAKLEVSGRCLDVGLVQSVIKNSGTGNMSDSTEYRIFLDAVVTLKNKIKLASGDSLILTINTNGKSARVEADQTVYYNGNRYSSNSIEGCTNNLTAATSRGYLNQLPQDDVSGQIEYSCVTIVDSYDPNDKAVTPSGITYKNYIKIDDELEYTVRFQNTGSASASKVVVSDKLDPSIEPQSFTMVGASHNYTVKMEGSHNPLITWTFNNINLAPKVQNELESNGFIRFKVKLKPNTALNTTISNNAFIYFDYNSPIVTNETINTLYDTTLVKINTLGIDICKNKVVLAKAGKDTAICKGNALSIVSEYSPNGIGQWRRLSGSTYLSDLTKNQLDITNITNGLNSYEWSLTSCGVISRDTVTIKRNAMPLPFESSLPMCPTDSIITFNDTNLVWYSDYLLTNQIGAGKAIKFFPSSSSQTLYIAKTYPECIAGPSFIYVSLKTGPSAPTYVSDTIYCKNSNVQLQVIGQGTMAWYTDRNLQTVVNNSNSLTQTITKDTSYFVQSLYNGCKSPVKELKIHSENPFQSIITLNGDLLTTIEGREYEWYLDGNLIPNSNHQSIKPSQNGTYTVKVTGYKCADMSDEFPFVLSGITTGYSSGNYIIFPNPAKDNVTIQLTNQTSEKTTIITIRTSMGQEVYSQTINSINNLNLSNLAEGIYFIEFKTKDISEIQKLVVQPN